MIPLNEFPYEVKPNNPQVETAVAESGAFGETVLTQDFAVEFADIGVFQHSSAELAYVLFGHFGFLLKSVIWFVSGGMIYKYKGSKCVNRTGMRRNNEHCYKPKFMKGRIEFMYRNIPEVMTFRECCELLRIGKNTLLGLLHTRQIEGFRIGNRWRIPKESVVEFIERR